MKNNEKPVDIHFIVPVCFGPPPAKDNILTVLLKKLMSKPATLRELKRPKDLPCNVPDCGWNHGKPLEK